MIQHLDHNFRLRTFLELLHNPRNLPDVLLSKSATEVTNEILSHDNVECNVTPISRPEGGEEWIWMISLSNYLWSCEVISYVNTMFSLHLIFAVVKVCDGDQK